LSLFIISHLFPLFKFPLSFLSITMAFHLIITSFS